MTCSWSTFINYCVPISGCLRKLYYCTSLWSDTKNDSTLSLLHDFFKPVVVNNWRCMTKKLCPYAEIKTQTQSWDFCYNLISWLWCLIGRKEKKRRWRNTIQFISPYLCFWSIIPSQKFSSNQIIFNYYCTTFLVEISKVLIYYPRGR